MLPYFWYILKVIICSGILFGYYWFFLRNKLFHQYNRFYLLASILLSLLLPLLKINFWQPATDTNQAIRVLQVVSAGDEYMNNIVFTAKRSSWNFEQLYPVVYILVSLIFFFVMMRTLFLIRTLLKKYPVQRVEDVAFVNTEDDSTPFSFLKYIFWNSSIDVNTTTGRQIFKHEVVHIREKHTHDKLFVNIVLIFCWSNPFFWLYRKELNMIHEFIADKKAVEDSDTKAFAAMILQAAYPKHRFELTNNFFYSPIKRRLLMLTKNKNPRVNYIGRIMVLPLAVLIFAAFTFKTKSSSSIYHGKKITVVIDAGHGGQDAGAKSADGILEKDLTLAIAKKVKELNGNNAIEIILVRDGDVYTNPQQKVEFAKSKNADLFISFHVDNGPKESANTKTGFTVLVAKDEYANAGNSKILASAITNEFSNNYGLAVTSKPIQRQAGIWILQANTCPAVLIEAGFINNEKDLAYLQTSTAKETIAKNLLTAIEKFASANKSMPATVNPSTSLQILPEQVSYQKIKDTLPDNAPMDPEKALLIVNGKIIGKGKKAAEEFNNLVAPSVSVKWLKRTEAIAKYGNEGADGACEVNYNEGAVFTTTYVDADKMSVFYIGMNNPVKIAAPNVKPEDLVVSISQGSISGINGNYIARVTHIGEVTLTLSKRDGTKIPASFTVMVKRLPDPNDPQFPAEFREKLKLDNNGILLKHKMQLEQMAKAEQDYAHQLAQLKMADTSYKKANLERKLKELELQKEKLNLQLEQQEKARLNYSEKLTLSKVADANFEKNMYSKSDLKVSPVLSIDGIRKVRMQVEQFKNAKRLTAGAGYKVESTTVYFSGEGFPYVKTSTFSGDELSKLSSLIKECVAGSVITFDDVKVKSNNGSYSTVEGISISLYSDEGMKNDNLVFIETEVNPMFTGGEDAWRKYLVANIKPGTPADEGWKEGIYIVTVKFIVHADGSVSDITAENYKGSKTARHCIEVIKNAPKWQPAVQNGRKVNAYKKQPITFVIEEQ